MYSCNFSKYCPCFSRVRMIRVYFALFWAHACPLFGGWGEDAGESFIRIFPPCGLNFVLF